MLKAKRAVFKILALWSLMPNLQAQSQPELYLSCDARSVIHKNTTREDLVKRFGEQNVRDDKIYIGEGFFEAGTVIFPDKEDKRLDIIWKDDILKISPKTARTSVLLKRTSERLAQEVSADNSQWIGPEGITLGTDMKFVERVNRRPFRIAGFGWDYSGSVASWQKGRLDVVNGCLFFLRFEPPDSDSQEIKKVQGDKIFSSGHPSMQVINPRVYQMMVSFETASK